jgi:NAD(P)-dependent dehydrogenase (short-subunit alcohol dehydrogenase family)
MVNKIALITGATDGLGKATALGLVKKNYNVIIAARNVQKGEAVRNELIHTTGNPDVHVMNCDLTSLKSVQELAQKFNSRYDHLDLLVNNAGIMLMKRQLTIDGIEQTFGVNHLSHFYLTHLLLDKLKQSDQGRIINVSAFGYKMAKFDASELPKREKYNGMQAYVNSKLCNLYFTFELAEKLKDTKVTVNAYHPGIARTRFGQDNGGIFKFISAISSPFIQSPEEATKTAIFLATNNELNKTSGKFFTKMQEVKDIKPIAFNNENKKALWTLSEQLTTQLLN